MVYLKPEKCQALSLKPEELERNIQPFSSTRKCEVLRFTPLLEWQIESSAQALNSMEPSF